MPVEWQGHNRRWPLGRNGCTRLRGLGATAGSAGLGGPAACANPRSTATSSSSRDVAATTAREEEGVGVDREGMVKSNGEGGGEEGWRRRSAARDGEGHIRLPDPGGRQGRNDWQGGWHCGGRRRRRSVCKGDRERCRWMAGGMWLNCIDARSVAGPNVPAVWEQLLGCPACWPGRTVHPHQSRGGG